MAPQDSASVHACAYLAQARTLEPSFVFKKCGHFPHRFSFASCIFDLRGESGDMRIID